MANRNFRNVMFAQRRLAEKDTDTLGPFRWQRFLIVRFLFMNALFATGAICAGQESQWINVEKFVSRMDSDFYDVRKRN